MRLHIRSAFAFTLTVLGAVAILAAEVVGRAQEVDEDAPVPYEPLYDALYAECVMRAADERVNLYDDSDFSEWAYEAGWSDV